MTMVHGGDVDAAARALGVTPGELIDFSASINPLGLAPSVRQAIVDAVDRVQHYPEPYARAVVHALADRWAVDPDTLLIGNGATDLIHFMARCWPGQRVRLVVPTFSEFHRAWPNAELVSSDESWPDDELLVLTNPVNPTGEIITVPSQRNGPTLVDESFLDFTEMPTCAHATFRLRSLTKFYAIPGLRIGAMIAPAEILHEWRGRREPWQVNVLAQAALLAALEDDDYAESTRRFVRTEAAWLFGELQQLPGVYPFPPSANYVFSKLTRSAADLALALLQRGMIVRVCTGWPGIDGEAVRLAVRTRAESRKLLAAWRSISS